jgi:NADH-quinone oxidoreductase subunit N
VTIVLAWRVGGDVRAEGVSGLAPAAAAGMLIVDNLAIYFKIVLMLFMVGVTALWFIGSAERERYGPEFFVLFVGSALGMVLMASTLNLLMMAIAIEMASLPSYAIVGFNKRNRAAAEASLKYVIFGGVSAAIMLYGISLLYGVFGTLNFGHIAPQAAIMLHEGTHSTIIGLGLLCTMGGIAFKIAAVPFHFWCPDVFEGAKIEVTAWLSVSSKAAAIVLLMRLVDAFSVGAVSRGVPVVAFNGVAFALAIMAAVTCTWGNFAAYRQNNVKRLLAYSSIAHAGYMMMACAIFTNPGFFGVAAYQDHSPMGAVLVYVMLYAVMNLGVFGVAAMVIWQTGSEEIDAFNGLGRRCPWLAVPMLFCLVSLVGLPPFAGFIGKYWLLLALGESGSALAHAGSLGAIYWTLLVVAVVNTLISLFFYFRIVKAMYLTDDGQSAFSPPALGAAMVNACGVALVLMGVIFIQQPRDLADRHASNLYQTPPLKRFHAESKPDADIGVSHALTGMGGE